MREAVGRVNDATLVSLPVADTAAFNAGGGSLLADNITPAATENALLLSTRMLAPNFATTPEGSWQWFPAGSADLWYGWSKEFHPARGQHRPGRSAERRV